MSILLDATEKKILGSATQMVLIDNTAELKGYAYKEVFLSKIAPYLAQILTTVDDNVDLHLSSQPMQHLSVKTPKDFINSVQNWEPQENSTSDLIGSIETIANEILARNTTRPTFITVITKGYPTGTDTTVSARCDRLVTTLKHLNNFSFRFCVLDDNEAVCTRYAEIATKVNSQGHKILHIEGLPDMESMDDDLIYCKSLLMGYANDKKKCVIC